MRWLALAVAGACSSCQATAYRGADTAGRELVVLARCGEEFVRVDGHEHASFRSITRSTLTTTDGRITYAASDDDGTFIVRDGRVVAGPFISITHLIRLDATRLAAVEVADERSRVHVVGPGFTIAHPWFDAILDRSMVVTGGAPAYVAERGGKQCVVQDAVVDRCVDGVSSLAATRSGVAYLAREGTATFVVRGASTFGPYEDVAGLYGSAANDRSFALVRSEDAWFVDDGVARSQPYDRLGEVIVTSTGRIVFWARNAEEEFVVVDGVAHGPFDQVKDRAIEIGADGTTIAFVARVAGRDVLHVGGRPYPPAGPFGVLEEFTIGPDGRIGWIAREGAGRVVVVDGTVLGAWSKATALTLLGPGRDVVVAHARGRDRLIQGSRERDLGVALADSLVVGSDGRSWAIASIGESGLSWHHSGDDEARAVDLEAVVGELVRGGFQGETTVLRDWLRRELEAARKPQMVQP